MTRRAIGVLARVVALALLLLATLAGWVVTMNHRDEASADGEASIAPGPSRGAATSNVRTPTVDSAAQIRLGAYLVRAGDCTGCHTRRGGAEFAGGRAIETPFGNLYAPNITPDPTHGLGAWSATDFWRALHNGRSRDGHLLYPAFPYTNYTKVVRADADAMFAYLKSVPAVAEANRPNELRFPVDRQAALAVWRALYFRPAVFMPDASRAADWNRGAYLVEGLGHCNACHAQRNLLGATSGSLDLAGGLIPVQNWYAPALTSTAEAGVADWDIAHVVELLKTGVSPHGAVAGPMGEVVLNSTQHLSDPDLRAMAVYLKALPASGPAKAPPVSVPGGPALTAGMPTPEPNTRGSKLYEQHCEGCHGAHGEGVAGAYPALAGNRAVTMVMPANLVHIVLQGGFAPSTAGNPRPYGMPPFAPVLDNDDVADLLSTIRSSWGNTAAPVSSLEVARYRSSSRSP